MTQTYATVHLGNFPKASSINTQIVHNSIEDKKRDDGNKEKVIVRKYWITSVKPTPKTACLASDPPRAQTGAPCTVR